MTSQAEAEISPVSFVTSVGSQTLKTIGTALCSIQLRLKNLFNKRFTEPFPISNVFTWRAKPE